MSYGRFANSQEIDGLEKRMTLRGVLGATIVVLTFLGSMVTYCAAYAIGMLCMPRQKRAKLRTNLTRESIQAMERKLLAKRIA